MLNEWNGLRFFQFSQVCLHSSVFLEKIGVFAHWWQYLDEHWWSLVWSEIHVNIYMVVDIHVNDGSRNDHWLSFHWFVLMLFFYNLMATPKRERKIGWMLRRKRMTSDWKRKRRESLKKFCWVFGLKKLKLRGILNKDKSLNLTQKNNGLRLLSLPLQIVIVLNSKPGGYL